MIQLREVWKEYRQGRDRLPVVRGVDLEIARGEFVSVMGPSGAGKSTLLHLIAGLDVPSRGEIVLGGRSQAALHDDELTVFRRRHVGIVFQFFNLLPVLTVEENVALPLLLDGTRPAAARPRVRALLERVGLAHRAAHRPDELSGGEAQRVAIARALVVEPLVLLADEPTGSLDSATGVQILELLSAVHRDDGVTVMMVTHDPRAAAYGTRSVRMIDGQLAA